MAQASSCVGDDAAASFEGDVPMSRRATWSRFCYAWRRIGIAAGVSRSWSAPSLTALEEVVRINELCAPLFQGRRAA
jgi:hypothetical protein